MTYLDLFAECISIATGLPLDEIKRRMHEYDKHIEPAPMMIKEASEHFANELLRLARERPERFKEIAVAGLPHAFDAIRDKTRH